MDDQEQGASSSAATATGIDTTDKLIEVRERQRRLDQRLRETHADLIRVRMELMADRHHQ